nr:GntR family transcriptional regulator [Microbacterium barkeri]
MTDALGTAGLQRGLLSDQIYALIKAMIKDSTLAPGEQLVESQLARQMQVSQAPVRDALKRLAHEGLVSHVRHQGNFVASYSAEEAAQAKVARVELEGLAGPGSPAARSTPPAAKSSPDSSRRCTRRPRLRISPGSASSTSRSIAR